MKYKNIDWSWKEDLDVLSYHDREVLLEGYDDDGNEYEAIGMISCDELVDVDEDSIEKVKEKENGNK
jgi:hypothetical protein